MNQLDKLIEQYERENKDLNCKTTFKGIIKLLEDEEKGLGQFITELLELALSRPTCSKEQRLFLNVLEKIEFDDRTRLDENGNNITSYSVGDNSFFDESDFSGIDLSGIIKGK